MLFKWADLLYMATRLLFTPPAANRLSPRPISTIDVGRQAGFRTVR